MRKLIDRTLFWFRTEDGEIVSLNERYFAIATLLNRLLNEKYQGYSFKFINVFFANEKYFEKNPLIPLDYIHFYKKNGGTLAYYGQLDFASFNSMSIDIQINMIWENACRNLERAARKIENIQLLEAIQYAYKKGLQMQLNPNFKLVESKIVLYGQSLDAAIWINFVGDKMLSKLALEKNGQIIFEKDIDETRTGIESFLEIYKGIAACDNIIVITGKKDVDYLPLQISVPHEVVVQCTD